ncbi:MAG: XRE family transcriptional regulator [Gammaproteobacteria bacterium]
MERVQGVNFLRIEWCCQQAEITVDQLAADLGISRATIEKARAGEPSFTFGQLKKLAKHFGRGALFFLEAGPSEEIQIYTPQFRTLTNQKPHMSARIRVLIQRAERHREIYRALRESLDDARPKFAAPRLSKNVHEAARDARAWLGLKSQRTFEEYRATVEACGILVFRSNGYSGPWQMPQNSQILGFNLYHADCPLIVVRKEVATTRQTFTLMHELGHVLLHKNSSIDDEADLYSQNGPEREVNAFAGSLLVPDEFLGSIDDAKRPADVARYDAWLQSQREAWGVSGEVILRRLKDNGRLTQNQYDAYKQWQGSVVYARTDDGMRMYRHREPKHVFGDMFVRTVLDALSARHITLAKASDYLDRLRIDDLHRLEQHYAGD